MELDRNTLFSIALELDLPSLLKFCSTSKKINNLICKRDDIWRSKIKKEYPVVNVAILKNPRETYMKIIDANKDSQKKFNRYLFNLDYEMRDILPKIYHVIWPIVGIIDQNIFMTVGPLFLNFKFLRSNLAYNHNNLYNIFSDSFRMGLILENIPELKKYNDEINRLRDLHISAWLLNKRIDLTAILSIVDKLNHKIPMLKDILIEAVYQYLYENGQIYEEGREISSLYLV